MQSDFIVQTVQCTVKASYRSKKTCTFTLFETLEDFYYIGFLLQEADSSCWHF